MKEAGGNLDKLGGMMQNQIIKTLRGNTSVLLELGTINGQLALVVPSLENPIPHGEYMLCRQLTLGRTGWDLTVTEDGQGTHNHPEEEPIHVDEGEHVHDVLIPETMRWIMPGDHVLVAWVGTEAIVVDLVWNSANYGG